LYLASSNTDLTSISLNTFIGNPKKSAVIIILDDDWSDLKENGTYSNLMGSYLDNQGFFPMSSLALYDNYADTDNLDKMMSDQTNKMKQKLQLTSYKLFLLSWTLTQSNSDAVNRLTSNTILNLANTANQRLGQIPQISWDNKTYPYPNIIYIDKLENTMALAVSLAVIYYGLKHEIKTTLLATRSMLRTEVKTHTAMKELKVNKSEGETLEKTLEVTVEEKIEVEVSTKVKSIKATSAKRAPLTRGARKKKAKNDTKSTDSTIKPSQAKKKQGKRKEPPPTEGRPSKKLKGGKQNKQKKKKGGKGRKKNLKK